MKVEIWSDIACPWCYIAKRRFDEALRTLNPKIQVDVQWRSYELDPSTPKGKTISVLNFLIQHKGISATEAEIMIRTVKRVGVTEKIAFNFDTALHVNTFDAHRLVQLAQQFGKGSEMNERLFSAYFEKGESLADTQKLVEITTELGIDESLARKCLKSNQFRSQLRRDEKLGKKLGITGVPVFIIDGHRRITGAQMVDAFKKVLEETYCSNSSETLKTENTNTCGTKGCLK